METDDMVRLLCASLVIAVSGCAAPDGTVQPAANAAAQATEALRDSAGRTVGTATVLQVGDSLQVRIVATGLARGPHGAHIHTTGLCTPPSFESAGPHWNPTARQHGKNNPAGMHKGDLPNLMVDAAGRGTLEYSVPGASMTGGAAALLDADGSAIVIHATADDFRTDPSGNSGGRIACAAFR